MANLKNHGGIYKLLERRELTRAGAELRETVAVCLDGTVLRNQGRGWKLSRGVAVGERVKREWLRDRLVELYVSHGYAINISAAAQSLAGRTVADAHAHEGAKRLRRLRGF